MFTLVLYILCVWTNVFNIMTGRSSIITAAYRMVSQPWKPPGLLLTSPALSLRGPGHHWSLHCVCSFDFPAGRMAGITQCLVSVHWAGCTEASLGLFTWQLFYFSPLYEWAMVCLSVHLLKDKWVTSKFGQLWIKPCEHPSAGFCVDISSQLLWVNTEEHDCWMVLDL